MDKTTLKGLVEQAKVRYMDIQHREWNGQRYGKTEMEMWQEASQVGPREWHEIIRVLAQGGDYYGMTW